MARLRYNNSVGTLGASLTNSGTTITFASAPSFATIVSPDYIPIVLEPAGTSPSANFEIVHLTAYTAGATTGTISRGQEGTSGGAHSNGVEWACGPVQLDALPQTSNYVVFTSSGSWSIPSGVTTIKIRAIQGGGGGGGGGSTNSATTYQGGGTGGGAGVVVDQAVALSSDTSLTITVGAGGTGGSAGASGGNGGGFGGAGGETTVVGAQSTTVYADTGTTGNPNMQNRGIPSSANNTFNNPGGSYGGGPWYVSSQENYALAAGPGCGGGTSNYQEILGGGPSGAPFICVVGAGAGANSNAAGTTGGNGGAAQQSGTAVVQQKGGSGQTATAAGGNGQTATQPGCGGGGGGGGANGGAGGAGGAGAAGQVEIWW